MSRNLGDIFLVYIPTAALLAFVGGFCYGVVCGHHAIPDMFCQIPGYGEFRLVVPQYSDQHLDFS